MACGMADWLNVGGLIQMLQDAATERRNLGKVGKCTEVSLDLKKTRVSTKLHPNEHHR